MPNVGRTQDAAEVQELKEKMERLEQELDKINKETEARQRLRITTEEEAQKEEEILTAVDKEEYTLTKEKKISLSYTISYGYSSGESFQLDEDDIFSQNLYEHELENSISISYGLLNNLSVSFGVPFIYRYQDPGTENSLDVTDIGDMSLGMGFRPFKSSGWMPNMSFHLSATLPTGRSPYKIDPEAELSTGGGLYKVGTGVSFSKSIDPVVAFGSLSYSHRFPKSGFTRKVSGLVLEKVEPGSSVGFKLGIAHALSYRTSINLSFSYTYQFSSTYYYEGGLVRDTSHGTSASFGVGTGWKVSPSTTLSLGIGIGLIRGDDFSISFSVPFDF